ncbi:MAG: hypothetical protein K8963_04825 [Proteobacteria bacterium]|nr:hypothetical protein [Pseudomonadota bacterium]
MPNLYPATAQPISNASPKPPSLHHPPNIKRKPSATTATPPSQYQTQAPSHHRYTVYPISNASHKPPPLHRPANIKRKPQATIAHRPPPSQD